MVAGLAVAIVGLLVETKDALEPRWDRLATRLELPGGVVAGLCGLEFFRPRGERLGRPEPLEEELFLFPFDLGEYSESDSSPLGAAGWTDSSL